MKLIENIRLKGFLVIVLICYCVFIQAQEPENIKQDTLELDEVVVVASRFPVEIANSAKSISVLTDKQIIASSPMSLPDLIDEMPGVWMQRTNHGGGSPFIRGLTGYQTLILIDGIRLNNATFRSGPNQYLNTIDPHLIQRVEVNRGTGSVQFGTDAIGGTIYLVTEDPDFSVSGNRLSAKVYSKWTTNDMEKTGRVQVNYHGRKIASSVGFSYSDFGDISAGGELGVLNHTGYTQYAGDLKTRVKIAKDQLLTLSYQHLTQSEVPLYHKLVNGDYSLYNFDPQQRDLAYLKLKSKYNKILFSELNTTVSYHRSLETRMKRKAGQTLLTEETDEVESYAIIIGNISEISDTWRFSTGIEMYNDIVHSISVLFDDNLETSLAKRGLYPDNSRMFNFSAFTLHEFSLNNLKVNTGLRYNYLILSVEDEEFGRSLVRPDALVADFSASYEVFSNTFIMCNISNAYRAPNINDVSSFGIADFRYELPNYTLQPEKAFNKEIGFKTMQRNFFFSLFTYHNQLTNLIVNRMAGYKGQDSIQGYRVYQRMNADKALLRGVESEIQFKVNRKWGLNGFLIYTYGENISAGEPMRRIPPLYGNIGIKYIPLKNFTSFLDYNFAGKQNRLSSGDMADDRIAEGGTPGWQTVNLRVQYRKEPLNIVLGATNILNEDYRLHGSGVDAPGRSFWISVGFHL